MSRHGNYRRVTHKHVLDDSRTRNYLPVGLNSIVTRASGSDVLHIVAPHDFWTQDEPIAYSVELVRPSWAYGNEGQLSGPLEFIGCLQDDWLDALDAGLFTEDDDPFPDTSQWVWALPHTSGRSPWHHLDSIEWYKALSTDAANNYRKTKTTPP